MVSTRISLQQEEWPDVHLSPAREEDLSIAPFLTSEPQPNDTLMPPPPSKRSFGLSSKASLGSFHFGNSRQNSTTLSRDRIESHTPSISESVSSGDTLYIPPQVSTPLKSPGSSLFNLIKRKKSGGRIRADSLASIQTAPPPVPSLPGMSTTSTLISSQRVSGVASLTSKKEKKRSAARPPELPVTSTEPEFQLDTNLKDMDGILDLTAPGAVLDIHGPSSSASHQPDESNSSSVSDHSFTSNHIAVHMHPSNLPRAIFTNEDPFHARSRTDSKRKAQIYERKISPKTVPDSPKDPSWKAPESWAVLDDGPDGIPEADYSSSDDSGHEARYNGHGHTVVVSPPGISNHRRRSHHHIGKKKSIPNAGTYKVRIYRADGSYHVASIPLTSTVAKLTAQLTSKLLRNSGREVHRLYLKERGRERILAQTECPAKILRRRLEQAGFDVADDLEELGAQDLSFLLKFVYKTQLLGPTEEYIDFDTFEYIDLAGRSLRTIPVLLHGHADTIVSLNLSRNPMLEIPLDFVQSCTTLRVLQLSHMAMKKVPQSVRSAETLYRLDISCNRIVDLIDAGLDHLPHLKSLYVQNNRMENLPWYFPRLQSLRYLNISNNKFGQVPDVIMKMTELVDLDISFNMIQALPEEIGSLHSLERLIMVGNRVSRFPDQCANLTSLIELDCRRNNISDLSIVYKLPRLETLKADHNSVSALDLALGPRLTTLDASYNDITKLSLVPSPAADGIFALTSLDISHAKLSSLDEIALGQLASLRSLKLDYNSFRYIPDSLCDLSRLEYLSCSDNNLSTLPAQIGRLQRLETLDVHHNSLTDVPPSLWNCASLCSINLTSNLLKLWHDPPTIAPSDFATIGRSQNERAPSIGQVPRLPPLAYSLERLYVGENVLSDEVLLPFTILKELRILNLSFNNIQEMPLQFFRNLTKLEEVYLSGNKLSSIPTEDLHRLTRLSTLFLNGNKFQTLPHELTKVKSLAILDVGSNVLKYNINNYEFDWNWNFNLNLKYLNLSGNKKLQIKPDTPDLKTRLAREQQGHKILADFSSLTQLRVLGLMDVTTTFVQNIPEESDTRRIRTSPSEVNKMAYGIADHIGRNDHLTMLDLVQPHFRDRSDEAVFAMFGQAQSYASTNRLSMYLHDRFIGVFEEDLDNLNTTPGKRKETVPDALRRAFLRLNKHLHDELYGAQRKMSQVSAGSGSTHYEQSSTRSGASGIVLYFVGKTMYVANAGDALAVVSTKQGTAMAVSRKHDPFDRTETARIRAAEGWVSPKGLVNDEIDVSRSFGYYHLLPVVNACPDICTRVLTDSDEFVIIANKGLWEYISFQDAVDIARSEISDPMIAAQKLRDFAISYGANGSTMIMVVNLAGLFSANRTRQPTMDNTDSPDTYPAKRSRPRQNDKTTDRNMNRLPAEIDPPTGYIALVFTDIRNSTHLWEVNAGMHSAFRTHNALLRRQYLLLGGYEVKTEGDAFMVSFPTTLAAVWWALAVQEALMQEEWPLEILECDDGKPVYDSSNKLVQKGISVRMGIHCGAPVCEVDLVNGRMDYFGPMVNRAARICSSALGGQIMCSADVMREINGKVLHPDANIDLSEQDAAEAIRRIGISVHEKGAIKLKGLEIPETLSAIYPKDLAGRHGIAETEVSSTALASRVHLSIDQIRQLGMLCLRLEALSSGRIFRTGPIVDEKDEDASAVMYGDPKVLLPPMDKTSTDSQLMVVLDSLSLRIENALVSLRLIHLKNNIGALSGSGLDERTLNEVLSLLRTM